uniref:Protein O-mannosyltransferase 1 n=1 Tax=Bombyx mori TaxID=7091 RepID=A0A8R2RAF8_BOMMO|nr:protein O-mannosyltransferase 1 isoform X3 [Bombyx mori]
MDTGRCVKNRKINKIRKEVTEPQEYSYSEKTCNSHREVGDGAPAENETEKPELMLTNKMNHSPSRIYLQLKIDVIAIGLLILALCTRLYKLDEPRHIVFDELHYGRYVSLYTKGVFFFDAHPPLGKQLLYLAGSIAGYDGNFTFDRIGTPYTDNVPVKALRLVPAVSGSFLVLITYFLMLELSLHQWTAILAALLVLLENCFLAQSRFMLLESIQILFGLCGVYCIIKSTKRIGLTALVWLCAAAVLLGCCFSHTHGRTCWLHSHAHVYPVRYADGRGSSHQQQVTCYSFKDVNNWWIVKRPDQASLAVSRPPDAIRHGDIVQLLHGITSRALNSHDVAAAVSPQSQEVSCYIDYNVSMPAQNLWRVDIVNRDSEESTWDSIRSLVRLVHVDTGSGLRYSGRQLPAWGFHQHEIVADKVLSHQDTIWNVEEHRYTKADDRKERERELVTAEMIPTAVTQLTFWEKFTELQYKMIAHAPDAPHGHMFASEPAEWPLLVRSIAYWLSPDSNAQIHLIGNIVTWYTGTISVVVYSALLAIYSVRKRRACEDLPPFVLNKFYETGYTLFLGYWLHYLPYFFIDRTLFLHHYLPAYIFKILLLAYIMDHIYLVLQLHEKTKHVTNLFILCVTIWLSYIVLTFKKFSVLNYGNVDLKENDLMSLRWKDTWDFILHKKI